MPRKAKTPKAEPVVPVVSAAPADSVSDEVSRSSLNESHVSAPEGTMAGSPLTETGSST